MSSQAQATRTERSASTASTVSTSSSNSWLELSPSVYRTPSSASSTSAHPFLELTPSNNANKKFRPVPNNEDQRRLMLLRARDNWN